MRTRAMAAALAMALTLPACGGGDIPDDLDALEWSDGRGCGDVFIYWQAGTREEDHVVEVVWPGLMDQAISRGDITETLSLPAGNVQVRYRFGSYLAELNCNDVVEFEPVERRNLPAVAGTATITIVPTDDGMGQPLGEASITLTDLTFEGDDGTIKLSGLTAENVQVGWLAG